MQRGARFTLLGMTGFDLRQTISLLSRTPSALDALLRDLPEAWTLQNEGEGTWSAKYVIGHLIDGERTGWIPRVKLLLETGDETPDPWTPSREHSGKTLAGLLDEFALARAASLAELTALNLQQEQLERLKSDTEIGPYTLAALLATWAVHDLTHLHQISRTLAHQYREAVGPWGQFLGVLQCNGHSV